MELQGDHNRSGIFENMPVISSQKRKSPKCSHVHHLSSMEVSGPIGKGREELHVGMLWRVTDSVKRRDRPPQVGE